jgi:hypothetical protein
MTSCQLSLCSIEYESVAGSRKTVDLLVKNIGSKSCDLVIGDFFVLVPNASNDVKISCPKAPEGSVRIKKVHGHNNKPNQSSERGDHLGLSDIQLEQFPRVLEVPNPYYVALECVSGWN